MHKKELVISDILNTSYFSEKVDLCNREADSALPSPRSRFSVHSTLWLLLLPTLQPVCVLQLDQAIGRRMMCTVLRLLGSKLNRANFPQKRPGHPNCFLFGRC